MDLRERFEAGCSPEPMSGCTLWTKVVRGHYGQLRGANGRKQYAHRVAYELAFGPIPAGQLVLHKCDNTLCVNFKHLFSGTQQDNVNDKVAKGRHPRGESAAQKLTQIEVDTIREMCGSTPQTVIASKFNISQAMVSMLNTGKTWNKVG